MEQKCGTCQKKRIANSSHAPRSNLPLAATQPIIGGIAPGNAPTNVAHTVRFFSGVYASKYARQVALPRAAGSTPAAKSKYSAPAIDNAPPKITASRARNVQLGRGRDSVRRMYRSDSRPMYCF